MTRRRGSAPRSLAATALVAGLVAIAGGCTSRSADPPPAPIGPGGAFQLVAFNSCDDALERLKSAAKAYVGPWGFDGDQRMLAADRAGGMPAAERAGGMPAADAGAKAGGPAAPSYSGTNTHEAGVDEPDLVKTDGRRIVTMLHGVLRVVDPATRRVTGQLDLAAGEEDQVRWADANLLLHGDRALVLIQETWRAMPNARDKEGVPPGPDRPTPINGPRLILVDLTGTPEIVSEYQVDGGLVDARQVGATARVVIRSAPRLTFPYAQRATDAQRVQANRDIIDGASADAWLPRYSLTSNGTTSTGRVGCDRVSRPAAFSGTSMVTVLSFDLGRSALGDGDPVTIVADGDTVYSNGPRLYVANDQRWRVIPMRGAADVAPDPRDQVTEIYQFDTSGPDRPRYVAAASVPGWLINQYAISEWDGHLRVATTVGRTWGRNPKSSSSVYVFRADGRTLAETGRVTGLGKGEQIYAVRFVGGVGYVVTFRQTDPLYTVDLRDPATPKVAGELKITGYSAYLHPVTDGRLLGIGQEASRQGRIQGTQISLFDVTDLTKPTRIAQHHVAGGHSEAEFDPHAFLYWPEDSLLVVPLTVYDNGTRGKGLPAAGALALRVGDGAFTEAGMISHPATRGDDYLANGMIRRSLVVDDVLWTVSDAGLKATDVSTLDTLAWLPHWRVPR